MPTDRLSNINYGQKNEDLSDTKILKVNGIGNGTPISSISANAVRDGSCTNMKTRAFKIEEERFEENTQYIWN